MLRSFLTTLGIIMGVGAVGVEAWGRKGIF